ncbi:MAG: PHP domain-containing protein [Actinophytocola sp.]|nr:PHP domain-containing protein [Actinophytocola sp.]
MRSIMPTVRGCRCHAVETTRAREAPQHAARVHTDGKDLVVGWCLVAADSFVHLHVHTEYSMLDGAAKVAPLFAEAARLGMPAVGMTDHGNMYGADQFYQESRKAGIKPIIGIEAYVAPASHYHKKPIFWARRASWTTGPPSSCSAAATASACSSSTVARCATCCGACSRPGSTTSPP